MTVEALYNDSIKKKVQPCCKFTLFEHVVNIFFSYFVFFATTLMSVDILDISPIPVILLILKVEGTRFSERETLFNLQEFNSFHVSN